MVVLWWSGTHPVTWSHHGLLLAPQFVEDVVGKLDAARPELPCKNREDREVSTARRHFFCLVFRKKPEMLHI